MLESRSWSVTTATEVLDNEHAEGPVNIAVATYTTGLVRLVNNYRRSPTFLAPDEGAGYLSNALTRQVAKMDPNPRRPGNQPVAAVSSVYESGIEALHAGVGLIASSTKLPRAELLDLTDEYPAPVLGSPPNGWSTVGQYAASSTTALVLGEATGLDTRRLHRSRSGRLNGVGLLRPTDRSSHERRFPTLATAKDAHHSGNAAR
jgi:hypothetical protein